LQYTRLCVAITVKASVASQPWEPNSQLRESAATRQPLRARRATTSCSALIAMLQTKSECIVCSVACYFRGHHCSACLDQPLTPSTLRIRRAYKRKALELHPDRNLNDVENATKRFAEVQTAYEILSDPQERAWYDSHRDAILSGEDDISSGAPGTERSPGGHTSASAIFDLMSRFNKSVPMDDSPRGFFSILNEFFDQLAAEETAASEYNGAEPVLYPPFGKSTDDYETVAKPFYSVWSSFSTRKSFSWRDKYRLSDAPDRRVRRLMEKENKKFREEGIREFNDAVLSLVAFVKKRDPRYRPNKQSEAERQQLLRNSVAAQAARQRAANKEKLAEFVMPEWVQSREVDENEGGFSLSEEEEEIEEIECVVCNKTFKSEKQFEAHEKSKKHIKAVQQLKRQMRKEDQNFDLQDPSPSRSAPAEPEDEEEGITEVPNVHLGITVEDTKHISPQLDQKEEEGQPEVSSSEEDDEYAPRSKVEERILGGNKKGKTPKDNIAKVVDTATASLEDLTLEDDSIAKPDGAKKIGKAKLKREKKAARQASEAQAANVSRYAHYVHTIHAPMYT